jgi:hypothetical protein
LRGSRATLADHDAAGRLRVDRLLQDIRGHSSKWGRPRRRFGDRDEASGPCLCVSKQPKNGDRPTPVPVDSSLFLCGLVRPTPRGGRLVIIAIHVSTKTGGGPRRVVRSVALIASGARHPGAAALAGAITLPRPVVMVFTNPAASVAPNAPH